jgi:ribosomal protein S1
MRDITTYTGMSEGFTGEKTTFLRDSWDDLYDALQMKTILQGKVSGVERDGDKENLVVFIDNVKGIISEEEIGESRPKYLSALIGSRINFKIKRCDRINNAAYLSRKDALEEMSGATWQRLKKDPELLLEIQKQIDDLRNGDEEITQETKRAIGELNSQARAVGPVRTATVRAVFKEGAYVDIGGVSVFLPAHEISWGKVEDAREIIKPGESFDIKVIRVDFDNTNVRASLKATIPDPWDTVEQRYAKGSIYSGTLVRTTASCSLVIEIEPGVVVICKRLPLQRLNEGAKVRVKIAYINPAKRFINGFLVGESRWVS